MTLNLHPENVDLSDYYDAEFVLTRLDLPASEPDVRSAVGRLVLYRGDLAVVRMWEPLGCSLCDVLLSFLDGDESTYPDGKCWVGVHACRPADGLGPLPDRNAACRRAAEEHRLFFKRQFADHVRKHLGGERWPYMEFARGHVGMMLADALRSAGGDPQAVVRAVLEERRRGAAQ